MAEKVYTDQPSQPSLPQRFVHIYVRFGQNFHPQLWVSPDKECYIKLLADIVDPDQTAPKEQSDLGLHCVLRYFCPDTESQYGPINALTSTIYQQAAP